MTGSVLGRQGKSWWECWQKMNYETLYYSYLRTNRYATWNVITSHAQGIMELGAGISVTSHCWSRRHEKSLHQVTCQQVGLWRGGRCCVSLIFFWISRRKDFWVSVFAELENVTGTVEFSFVLLRKFIYDLSFLGVGTMHGCVSNYLHQFKQ